MNKINASILFVEDEASLREHLAIFLGLHFERVTTAVDGRDGLEAFQRVKPDAVISDIRMPNLNGLQLAAALKSASPETPVILCSAFTDTEYLLKGIELGVSAYVRKPVDAPHLLEVVKEAIRPALLRREVERLSRESSASMGMLLGRSPVMEELVRQASRVASSSFNVLLLGETGVGKTRLAALIHGMSPRKERPFVPVQMASLPETLAEAELFGYERGAFTDARQRKAGLFTVAHGGTLFLDDIDAAPPGAQAKLLRAVEEKRFYPLGSTVMKAADVRVLSASNLPLKREVAAGRFREDLYYRLADLVLTVPPLRERPEDIRDLARVFLSEAAADLRIPQPALDAEAEAVLGSFAWPGNLRELKTVMKRAALAAAGAVTAAILRGVLDSETLPAPQPAEGPAGAEVTTLRAAERRALEQAVAASGGKLMQAARLLGIDYKRFRRLMARHRLG